MMFNTRSLGFHTGHRTNVSPSRVAARRAMRPGVEALERRALLATVQLVDPSTSGEAWTASLGACEPKRFHLRALW